jgi:predicted nucleic-acid-binding Zn-ribbon protein
MPDYCVKCKNYDIFAGEMISEGDTAWIEVSCKNCGAHYYELYRFEKIEDFEE